jgi:hypothetical protein
MKVGSGKRIILSFSAKKGVGVQGNSGVLF